MQKEQQPLAAKKIIRIKHRESMLIDDLLVVEEPMEIRILFLTDDLPQEKSIAVTMRTPGNDFELALGFLFNEGIIQSFEQVETIKYCDRAPSQNVVKVILSSSFDPNAIGSDRHFFMTSSCGICGKSSIEAVFAQTHRLHAHSSFSYIPLASIYPMTESLRKHQPLFKYTGGIHAAGLFDLEGKLMMVFEDVGRHNALDKLIGAALRKKWLPLHPYCLIVSGRISFELVQKALMAGVKMIGAVGAPTHLAVELAETHKMTLIGFIKEHSFNVYTGGTNT